MGKSGRAARIVGALGLSIAVLGAAVWATVALKDNTGWTAPVSAVATALAAAVSAAAAVFSYLAARAAMAAAEQSRQTAAEARAALSLHFRPRMLVRIDRREERGRELGSVPYFELRSQGDPAVQVDDLQARWVLLDGREHVDRSPGLDAGRWRPMDGATVYTHGSTNVYVDVALFEVSCVDVATRTRWTATLERPGERGLNLNEVSLSFERQL